jgi:hypothetical protein
MCYKRKQEKYKSIYTWKTTIITETIVVIPMVEMTQASGFPSLTKLSRRSNPHILFYNVIKMKRYKNLFLWVIKNYLNVKTKVDGGW